MAASSLAVPASLAVAPGSLDVLLPALGAHAATRARPVSLLEAVRAFVPAVTGPFLALSPSAPSRPRVAVEAIAVAARIPARSLVDADAQLAS